MNLLKKIFGPRQDEVWRQLSDEIGAQFIKGGFFKSNKVEARIKNWIVTLDTFTVSTGKTVMVFTRMRAPFRNRDGFRFSIHRKEWFSGIGKMFGAQDLEVGGPKFESLEPLFGLPSYLDPQVIESGDPEFDRDFIIKSNDEQKVKMLFKQLKIRELIQSQPAIELQVKAKKGRIKKGEPPEMDELYFQEGRVIKDLQRLKQLFELYAELLRSMSS